MVMFVTSITTVSWNSPLLSCIYVAVDPTSLALGCYVIDQFWVICYCCCFFVLGMST